MRHIKIVNKFKYALLYNHEISGSFKNAYYCGEFDTLNSAVNEIKSIWENNETQDGKYFIALITDDMYHPIMYAIRNRLYNTVDMYSYL